MKYIAMESCYAMLKYHERRNCFGYLQLCPDIETFSTVQDIGSKQFSCAYNVIRCESPKNYGIIQIFTSSKRFNASHVLLLFLNKTFADLFGFHENDEIILQKMPEYAHACTSFEVELSSAEDWNIVQNSSQRIEELFLGQLRLVTVGQTYPIWVTQNISVYFTVVRIDTSSSRKQNACISEFTEVHVKPFYDRKRPNDSQSSSSSNPENYPDVFPSSFTFRINSLLSAWSLSVNSRIDDYCGDENTRIVARVLPEMLCKNMWAEEADILAVFRLNQKVITICAVWNDKIRQLENAVLVDVPTKGSSHFGTVSDCLKQYDSRYCAFSSALHQLMNGEYEWMKIFPLPRDRIHQVETLEVFVEDNLPEDFEGRLKEHFWKACQLCPVVVPFNGLTVHVNLANEMRIQCLVRPRQAELTEKNNDGNDDDDGDVHLKCFILTNQAFPSFKYSTKIAKDSSEDNIEDTNGHDELRKAAINFGGWKNEATELSFQNTFVSHCYDYIMYQLKKRTFSSSENILITGGKSTGKTTILQLLAQKLLHSHLAVYSECLCCINWNGGRSVEKLEDRLNAVAIRLARRQPSVLFLDNLDFFSRSREEDTRNIRLERFAEMLRDLANENELLVVATTNTKREILELFSLNTGKRFFSRVECIQGLDVDEREECLEKFCGLEKVQQSCNLRSAAEATEKCTVGDLERLAQRIILESRINEHAEIEENDIKQALVDFRPIAQPIEQPKLLAVTKKLNWNDVGGLKNVIQILTEVFIWPTKYPSLYRNSSIRLGHGVLLHGPSGCGKTLICRVLAAECGFNVIFIKGPELLSKYVGESEENVRKTFDRARATSPCLIFFDEFDSLGPKRGNGDTGVADRVVNQLLTELDGVEGLEGVYVLAATNRIDLIDSALLRPGRFDYIVKCELPRMEDRKSILDILCRDVKLEKDVELKTIAKLTDGWTGADLKGLINNAQLLAHRRTKGAVDSEYIDLDEDMQYTLTQADLLFAMKESEPKKNRTESERKRYISAGMLTTLA